MNSRFRPLLPGELHWSGLARYKRRLGLARGPFQQQIGVPINWRPTPVSVNYLDRLASKLPPELGYSADYILNEHTLHRLYCLADRSSAMSYHELPRSKKGGWRGRKLFSRTAETLRFCPECVIQHRAIAGEAGWSTVHQVPGMNHCHLHLCPLIDTTISAASKAFTALDDVACTLGWCILSRPSDAGIAYAQVVGALFKMGQPLPPLKFLNTAVAKALFGANARVEKLKVAWQIATRITDQLPSVAAVFGSDAATQTRRIRSELRGSVRPIFGIATLAAIAISGKSLDALVRDAIVELENQGPYPCINKFSSCYKKLTIRVATISKKRAGAAFTCPKCMHCYQRSLPLSRTGPENTDFAFRLVCHGEIPRRHFTAKWKSKGETWKSLEKHFGLSRPAIARMVIKHQLPDTEGRTLGNYLRRAAVINRTPRPNIESALRSAKDTFLNLVSVAGRTRRQCRRLEVVREYIRTYEPTWLVKFRGWKGIPRRCDWAKREQSLIAIADSARITALAKPCKNNRRLTFLSIARAFDPPIWGSALKRMPLLRKLLKEMEETEDDYQKRRASSNGNHANLMRNDTSFENRKTA